MHSLALALPTDIMILIMSHKTSKYNKKTLLLPTKKESCIKTTEFRTTLDMIYNVKDKFYKLISVVINRSDSKLIRLPIP